MKTKNILLLLLSFLPGLLGIVSHVVITNGIAIDGKKLATTEIAVQNIKRQNKELEMEIAQNAAISVITKRAEKLNLHPAQISFLLPEDKKLASRE